MNKPKPAPKPSDYIRVNITLPRPVNKEGRRKAKARGLKFSPYLATRIISDSAA